MRVWVLERDLNYEGMDSQSLHATPELAQAALTEDHEPWEREDALPDDVEVYVAWDRCGYMWRVYSMPVNGVEA